MEAASSSEGLLDFEDTPEAYKKFLSKIEPIKCRRVPMAKPLAIIYNPNSGRKVNLMPRIKDRLDEAGIPHEFLLTQRALDTYRFA